jgi:transposase
VRRLSVPQGPAPHIIGIDDWAWHKGQRYGTLIVDLERGCPIDVLEDRAAETVAAWLQARPDVTIVARDRTEAYAAGIRQGAPEATQVADRFHFTTWQVIALPGEIDEDRSSRRRINSDQDDTHVANCRSARDDTSGHGSLSRRLLSGRKF